MKVIILAAGSSIRAYPLTKEAPKALLPIKGRPLVEYAVNKVQGVPGVDKIYIVTSRRFYRQFQNWLADFPARIPVEIIDDGSINHKDHLGAVGDLMLAIEKKAIQDDVLVLGGDNVFSFTLSDFVSFAHAKISSPVIGVYNQNGRLKASRFGIATLDENGVVIDFNEKPASLNGSRLVSLCLYYFPASILALLREYTLASSAKDSIGSLIQWLSKKERMFGYRFNGSWYDVGDVDSYAEAVCSF